MHVLLVFNVPKILRNKQLFNLFSLYGNIERIVLARDKRVAVITFESENDQMVAFHYLNNQSLYDSVLHLVPLKYPFILLQKSPFLPFLNFLEFFFVDSLTLDSFAQKTLFFRSNIPFYIQNFQKLISSNSLFYLLHPRLSGKQDFNCQSFLRPLADFLFGFETLLPSLRDPANHQQFSQFSTDLDKVETLSHLKGKSVCESFETFCLNELPLELDVVNYRNNQKKSKDGGKSKKIIKPNRILYIFNLSSNMSLDSIRDMFEGFEKVEKHFYLNESKNSALFYFRNVQAACHILCAFKNMKLIEKYFFSI